MPNWVTNIVKISGPEAKVKEIRNKLQTPETVEVLENGETKTIAGSVFDLNNIIPMPESLLNAVESPTLITDSLQLYLMENKKDAREALQTMTNQDLIYDKLLLSRFDRALEDKNFLQNIDKDIEEGKYDFYVDSNEVEKITTRDQLSTIGETYYNNITNYGHPTWYGWSVNNWGTKWNTVRADYDENYDVYSFETAWSAPKPVIETLAKTCGDGVEITHAWADEDTGHNTGITHYICKDNGFTSRSYIPDGGSIPAYTLAVAVNNREAMTELVSFYDMNSIMDDNDNDINIYTFDYGTF